MGVAKLHELHSMMAEGKSQSNRVCGKYTLQVLIIESERERQNSRNSTHMWVKKKRTEIESKEKGSQLRLHVVQAKLLRRR